MCRSTTRPEVRFYCGDENVHMAAGEAWVFDNWRLHRVENPTQPRAHPSGCRHFGKLELLAAGGIHRRIRYSGSHHRLRCSPERQSADGANPARAGHDPAEVDLLIIDLRAELMLAADSPDGAAHLTRYHLLLDALCRDWRQLFGLYGTRQEGWREFVMLRDRVRAASRSFGDSIIMRTNRVAAHPVLEGRVLRAMLSLPRRTGSLQTRRDAPVLRWNRRASPSPHFHRRSTSLRQHVVVRDAGNQPKHVHRRRRSPLARREYPAVRPGRARASNQIA